jgi:hypothetical protein
LTGTETVTVEEYTTTIDVSGHPETVTVTSTITTVDTAPVTVSEVETYTEVITVHGHTETVTETTTVSSTVAASTFNWSTPSTSVKSAASCKEILVPECDVKTLSNGEYSIVDN